MLGKCVKMVYGYAQRSSSSLRKSVECSVMLLCFTTALIPVKSQLTTVKNELNLPYYYVGCYTEEIDLLRQTLYTKSPQDCVDNCKYQSYMYAILSAELCFCSNEIVAANRHDDQFCNIRCQAIKSMYCGGKGFHSYYSTMLKKELIPSKASIINSTEHSLLVAWESNESDKYNVQYEDAAATNGTARISNFLIRSNVLHSYSKLPFFPQPEFIVQSSENHFEVTDLHPGTTYNVTVVSMCGHNVCGSTSLIGATTIGEPSPKPEQPLLIESTNTTTTVRIPPIRNNNGPVSKVLVIVEHLEEALTQTFDASLLDSWQKAQESGLSYYITAELFYQPDENKESKQFVVGDGKYYGRYLNAPLDNNAAHVHIGLGVVSSLNGVEKRLYSRSSHEQHEVVMTDFSYATFEAGKESIIALTVTCVVFATCLLLSLVTYFYLRYKTCQVRNTVNRLTNAHEMTLQQPIIESENNGFVVEEELPVLKESCKQQLNKLLAALPAHMQLPRNALRMNVNDVIAEGSFGEVITGTLIHALPTSPDASHTCRMHILGIDDLSSENQLMLLREYSNLTRLTVHENILEFYGVSASADWLYFLFEHQTVSLKRRLIESRRAPSTLPVQRITTLSEQLVLQWIYELTTTLQYLADKKIVHRKLCSHNVFVTAEAKIKLSVFGPIPFVSNYKNADISRWLAPEVLRYQHYSSKSDVWALGCVAWECCSLGATPYPNITDSRDLLPAIKGGARPAQPSFVYNDLYQMFLNCWQLEPSDRTSFEDIAFNVRQLMTSPRHALSFDRVYETQNSNILDTLPFYLPMLEQCN